jgi:integrase
MASTLPVPRSRTRRGKTGADHIVPLWPETVEALKLVLAQRPDDALVFRTRHGNPWCRTYAVMKGGKVDRASGADHVNERFTELIEPIGLKIDGQGFYKLKHLFATTADKSIDRNAVAILMGHKLPGSRGHYIEVGEDRLREVVNFVRHHLLSP